MNKQTEEINTASASFALLLLSVWFLGKLLSWAMKELRFLETLECLYVFSVKSFLFRWLRRDN